MADGYKDDLLVNKLASIDARLNEEDDQAGVDENTPEDTFQSLDERLETSDTIEFATYELAQFAWATHVPITATASAWGARRFVVL